MAASVSGYGVCFSSAECPNHLFCINGQCRLQMNGKVFIKKTQSDRLDLEKDVLSIILAILLSIIVFVIICYILNSCLNACVTSGREGQRSSLISITPQANQVSSSRQRVFRPQRPVFPVPMYASATDGYTCTEDEVSGKHDSHDDEDDDPPPPYSLVC